MVNEPNYQVSEKLDNRPEYLKATKNTKLSQIHSVNYAKRHVLCRYGSLKDACNQAWYMVTAVRDLVRSQLKKYTATPADD